MKHFFEIFKHIIHHSSRLKKESIAAIIAIGIEYYNLFATGYLSPIVNANFFSSESNLISVLLLLTSFVVAPLGALVCGHIGDKFGRKIILVWTIALISIASLLISILGRIPILWAR